MNVLPEVKPKPKPEHMLYGNRSGILILSQHAL